MEVKEFKIRFVTPLLIDGANKYCADSIGLTGKALRGSWHFWFRAIIGGIFKDIKNEELLLLESKIFGSPDTKDSNGDKIGAKFRMIVDTENEFPDDDIKLGFNKPCRNCRGKGCYECRSTGKSRNPAISQGYLENSSYTIRIIPRSTMSEMELKVLFSIIWVWGNLGSVGKRERRGFGSPVIYSNSKNNPFLFSLNEKSIELPIKEIFEYTWKLEEHLRKGLNLVWDVCNLWIEENNFVDNKKLSTSICGANIPVNSPFFLLRSCGQIFVGSDGFIDRNDAISKFHGDSKCDGLGWAKGTHRMASPVFIRFHQIKKDNVEKLIPLVSWCQQKNIEIRGPNNCALEYLKNMQIDGQDVFVNNLNGGTL